MENVFFFEPAQAASIVKARPCLGKREAGKTRPRGPSSVAASHGTMGFAAGRQALTVAKILEPTKNENERALNDF
jgi:hypothetical protein